MRNINSEGPGAAQLNRFRGTGKLREDVDDTPAPRVTPRPTDTNTLTNPGTAAIQAFAPASAPAAAPEPTGLLAQIKKAITGPLVAPQNAPAPQPTPTPMAPQPVPKGKPKPEAVDDAPPQVPNDQVPIAPAQAPLFAALTQPQQTAFRNLSSDQRGEFADVFSAIGANAPNPTTETQRAAGGMLMMLEAGTLTSKDFMGGVLLDTLETRAHEKPDPRMGEADGASMVRTLLAQVSAPTHMSQGRHTHTCASAALQTILATQDPAEYVRLASALVFDGKATLKSGDAMELDARQVSHEDDAGRTPLSQAVQGSFEAFASKFPEQGDSFSGGKLSSKGKYGGGRLAGAHKFGGGTLGSKHKYGSDEGNLNGGLTQNQIEQLYDKVIGQSAAHVETTADNLDSVMTSINRALQAGLKVPIGVVGHDEHGEETHHEVTLLAMKDGPKGPTFRYSDSGTGDEDEISEADLRKALEAVIAPAEYMDHSLWDVGSVDDPDNDPADLTFKKYQQRGGGGRNGTVRTQLL